MMMAALCPLAATRAEREKALTDAARSIAPGRFVPLLRATLAQYGHECNGNHLLAYVVQSLQRCNNRETIAVGMRDGLACIDAILELMPATDPSHLHLPSFPTKLVEVLELVHTDPVRERRPMWGAVYHRLLPACELALSNGVAFMDRIAKEQRWLMHATPMAIADEPPARERLAPALPAVLWNNQPPHIIVEKLRAYNAVADSVMLEQTMGYIEHFPSTKGWADMEETSAIVRVVIEMGADPLTQRAPLSEVIWTPLGELLHNAQAEARARIVAVMMATHPRLGAQSPLRGWDTELLRKYLAPACSGSVTVVPPLSDAAAALRRALWFSGQCAVMFQNKYWGPNTIECFLEAVRSRAPPTPQLIRRLALSEKRASVRGARAFRQMFKRLYPFLYRLALAPQTLTAAERVWPKILKAARRRLD